MSLRFTGPRFGFQDHSLQGGDGRAEQMQQRPRLASVPAGVCLSQPVSVLPLQGTRDKSLAGQNISFINIKNKKKGSECINCFVSEQVR